MGVETRTRRKRTKPATLVVRLGIPEATALAIASQDMDVPKAAIARTAIKKALAALGYDVGDEKPDEDKALAR